MPTQSSVKEKTMIGVKEPRLYNVIMLNDEFTPMNFVVEILMDIVHKDKPTAETLMLTVHKSGKAVVAKYPYDIANTKANEAMSRAKAEGYPFRLTVSEEDQG